MKPGLQVGESHEFRIQVTEAMRVRFDDIELHPLYSTAAMMTHMEWAARQHILPYLEPEEEGVGCQIEIRHLHPTPIGAWIRVKSTVSQVHPKRITSQVEAWNDVLKIGEGTIVQAIVLKDYLREAAGI